MENLIKSLTILAKYIPGEADSYARNFPTCCEHSVLMVPSISQDAWATVTLEDKKLLDELGWSFLAGHGCVGSFTFGSC